MPANRSSSIDESVTATRLAAVVGPLIEIHGQHDQQRLLQAAWQRDVLDAFGGHGELRANVAELVEALRSNEAALRELVVDPQERQRRLELAQHAADEIELADPRDGEVDELKARLELAGNAQRIASLLTEAAAAKSRLAPASVKSVCQPYHRSLEGGGRACPRDRRTPRRPHAAGGFPRPHPCPRRLGIVPDENHPPRAVPG